MVDLTISPSCRIATKASVVFIFFNQLVLNPLISVVDQEQEFYNFILVLKITTIYNIIQFGHKLGLIFTLTTLDGI